MFPPLVRTACDTKCNMENERLYQWAKGPKNHQNQRIYGGVHHMINTLAPTLLILHLDVQVRPVSEKVLDGVYVHPQCFESLWGNRQSPSLPAASVGSRQPYRRACSRRPPMLHATSAVRRPISQRSYA